MASASFEAESWRLKCLADAYLYGLYAEQNRQVTAGEEPDHDKAVRAGNAIERKVAKIVGDGGMPPSDTGG